MDRGTRLFFMAFLMIVVLGLNSACVSLNTPPQKRLKIEKVWVRDTPEKPYFDFRRVHRMTPVLTETLVIAGNSIDGLVAYDRVSASEVWRLPLDGGVEAGVAEDRDHLYFGAGDGFFYKIKKINGEVIWSFPIRAEGLGQPTLEGNRVYFLAGNNIVYCLNTGTGKSVWLYNRRDPSNISVRGGSRPSVDDSNVYVGFSDGAVVALKKESGNLVWETVINKNKRFQDVDAHPYRDGGDLFVAGYDNSLHSLKAASGESQWQIDLGGYSSPYQSGNTLFYATTEKKIVALQKSTGQKIWEQPLRSLGTRPEEFKGLLVVGEFIGRLKFLDMQTGELIREFAPGRGVHSKVTIDKKTGDVFFMSADGNLFHLNIGWSDQRRLWTWEDR